MGTRRHRLIHAAREHHAQKARLVAYQARLDKLADDLNGDDEHARQAALEQVNSLLGALAHTLGVAPAELLQERA